MLGFRSAGLAELSRDFAATGHSLPHEHWDTRDPPAEIDRDPTLGGLRDVICVKTRDLPTTSTRDNTYSGPTVIHRLTQFSPRPDIPAQRLARRYPVKKTKNRTPPSITADISIA